MFIRTDLLCAMIQVPVKVGLAKAIEYFRKVWLSLNILFRFNPLICFSRYCVMPRACRSY